MSVHSEAVHSAQKYTPQKKLSEMTSIRERSASGIKNHQQRPELVSQYR